MWNKFNEDRNDVDDTHDWTNKKREYTYITINQYHKKEWCNYEF